MSDIKGSALPSASSLSLTDLILVVINPGTSPETRNATLAVLATALAGSVAGTLTAGDDPRVTQAVQASMLGDAAFANFGTDAGTAAAGDDARLVNAQLYTPATFSNEDWPLQSSDRVAAQIGTMSAARTVTLPLANSLNVGETITVIDLSGTLSSANKIIVAVSGSDTINGAASCGLIQPYEQFQFTSDGISKWTRTGNHYGLATIGDTNYTALSTDKVILYSTALTAARTVTLPDSTTLPAGYQILVQDANAVINPNSGFNLTVAPFSGQTVNGSSSGPTMNIARSGIVFTNSGTSAGWKYDAGALRKTSAQVKLADGWSVNAANTTLPAQTRFADQFGTLTTPITVTLPAASGVPYNQNLFVMDTSGTCSATNTITVTCAGTDRLNGVTTGTYVINQPYGSIFLTSNGSNSWTYSKAELRASNNLGDLLSAATARTNLGLDPLAIVKTNLGASTDPAVGNDGTQGYGVGSIWVNGTTGVVFFCTNNATGAAVWNAQSGSVPDIQLFTTSGTWTKPAGAKVVEIYVMGGGGGGGAGGRFASGVVSCGGGGGAGAGLSRMVYPASSFGATETVTVGAGGAGGAAQTVDSTAGASGTIGGSSNFKSATWAKGSGANFGSGGTSSTGLGGGGSNGSQQGSSGAAASTTGLLGNNSLPAAHAGCGGASGGGVTTAPAQSAGGIGSVQASIIYNSGAGAAGGTAGGGVGANGANVSTTSNTYTMAGGGGGGGGGSATAAAGGAGGNGGNYGSGGGGGGASLNTFASGAGGTGGSGVVLVYTY